MTDAGDNPLRAPSILAVYRHFGRKWDGISDYTALLAEEWEKAGIKSAVLAGENGRDPDVPFPVFCWNGAWNIFTSGSLFEAAKTSGCSVIQLHYVPQVYAPFGFSLMLFDFLARLHRAGRQCIILMHEVYEPFTERFWRWPLGLLQRFQFLLLSLQADALVFTTPVHRNRLRRSMPWIDQKSRFVPVTSTLPRIPKDSPRREKIRNSWGLSPEAFALGIISRSLHEAQGIEVLLKGGAILKKQGITSALILLGPMRSSNPQLAGHLDTLAASLDVKLLWTGELPAEDISAALQSLDAYTAAGTAGPSPRSTGLMAALQHELPVLSSNPWQMTDFPGFSEAAVLTDPGSPEACAQAMRNLFQNKERLSRAAGELYRLHFSPFEISQQMLAACGISAKNTGAKS